MVRIFPAFAIVGMENSFAGFGSQVTIIMGATFVVCVLAILRGIVGEINGLWARRSKVRAQAPVSEKSSRRAWRSVSRRSRR